METVLQIGMPRSKASSSRLMLAALPVTFLLLLLIV